MNCERATPQSRQRNLHEIELINYHCRQLLPLLLPQLSPSLTLLLHLVSAVNSQFLASSLSGQSWSNTCQRFVHAQPTVQQLLLLLLLVVIAASSAAAVAPASAAAHCVQKNHSTLSLPLFLPTPCPAPLLNKCRPSNRKLYELIAEIKWSMQLPPESFACPCLTLLLESSTQTTTLATTLFAAATSRHHFICTQSQYSLTFPLSPSHSLSHSMPFLPLKSWLAKCFWFGAGQSDSSIHFYSNSTQRSSCSHRRLSDTLTKL